MDALIRVLLVSALLGMAYGAIRVIERRSHLTTSPFRPGLTLVVGPGCTLCEPAERALKAFGALPEIIDVSDAPPAVVSLSLPIAIVTNRDGAVVMQRSGRSAIVDASEIAESAAAAMSPVS
jgi:hypothetical protein